MLENTACKDWSKLVKMRNITSEEYDLLCDATDENNDIMHWKHMASLTDTLHDYSKNFYLARGFRSARDNRSSCGAGYLSENQGFRPAFEALSLNDCSDLNIGDVVIMGTLYVRDTPVKVPADPTWKGDVIHYGKHSVFKIALETALENANYQMKAIYVGNGLFVCDRVMLSDISQNQLYTALFTDMATKDWSKLVRMRNIASNEYNKLCDVTDEDNDIMHWGIIYSITDTVQDEAYHKASGYCSAKDTKEIFEVSYSENYGFRPAFEASHLNDCAGLKAGSVVVMGTLYVGNDPIKVPTIPVWKGNITDYTKNYLQHDSPAFILRTALNDPDYQMRAVYVGNGLFICDRCMLSNISWYQINKSLYRPKASAKDWSTLVKLRNITSEEYDLLCDAAHEDNDLMHWEDMYSITDTVYNENASDRVVRGYGSARGSFSYGVAYYDHGGFRPAFESLNPNTDCADLCIGDVVVMGTLYVGSVPVKVPKRPTYYGDIVAYDRDITGVNSKITLGTALEDADYQVKVIYVGNGVFVCDRCMLNHISWNQLNATVSKQVKCQWCGCEGFLGEDFDVDNIGDGFWCPDCDGHTYFDAEKNQNRRMLLLLESEGQGEQEKPDYYGPKLKKQLSPLRYPGGKSKLVDLIASRLQEDKCETFVEVFAGGASVGLSLLDAGIVQKLVLNDLDWFIYNFWWTVKNEPEQLIRKIREADVTHEFIMRARRTRTNIPSEIAFNYLLLNRCSYSGIVTDKSGLMGGKNGTTEQLTARWNPEALIRRIEHIHKLSDRIEVTRMDACELIEKYAYWDEHTTLFIDPPYVKAGPQLYRCYFEEEQHRDLADLLNSLYTGVPGADLILTYDDCELIRELYPYADQQVVCRTFSCGPHKK